GVQGDGPNVPGLAKQLAQSPPPGVEQHRVGPRAVARRQEGGMAERRGRHATEVLAVPGPWQPAQHLGVDEVVEGLAGCAGVDLQAEVAEKEDRLAVRAERHRLRHEAGPDRRRDGFAGSDAPQAAVTLRVRGHRLAVRAEGHAVDAQAGGELLTPWLDRDEA